MTSLPFIEYNKIIDYSEYSSATSAGYTDRDNDFVIGQSGGFLMKMDFVFINTEQFSEVGNHYKSTCTSLLSVDGVYCKYPKGTKLYEDFWTRETDRRRRGMTANCKVYKKDIPGYLNSNGDIDEGRIKHFLYHLNSLSKEEQNKYIHPLRITGDFYNYLNYGRILRTPNVIERAELDKQGKFKVKQVEGFPRFWDGDYWNFKIDEFIAANDFHLTKGKARGKGYSYKRGSQAANTVNLNEKVTVVLAAFDISYLTDAGATTDMAKTNLDWYENNTYWHRNYLSEDYSEIELGYKKSSTGNKKYGFRSKILSVTLRNNPSAAIGKRAIEIDFEEAGKCPNLKEALGVTMSSTEVGSGNIGTIRVYGTGGVKEADYKAFCDAFYSPTGFDMMPFENVWDDNARNNICGFFHPQVWNLEPYIDSYGNSLLESAYTYDIADKANKEKDLTISEWITYVGQRANKPSEAFRTGGENIFSSPELSNHVSKLKADSSLRYWRDGQLVRTDKGNVIFKTNQQLLSEGVTIHPYVENVPFKPKDDVHGCVREYYPPYMINGSVPDDLYYVVMDTIGKDKSVKELTIKNSLNGIYVLMYPNNIANSSGDIIVAGYVGRTNQMEDADRIADLLCERYNAKCLPEVDRGNTVSNFRKWGKLYRLHRNPLSIIEEKLNVNTNADYGITIGTGERKVDGLIYLKDWLYTPVSINQETGETVYILHYIKDIPLLTELLMYNSTGNFDRVSTMIVAMYQRLAYRTLRKTASASISTECTTLRSLNLYGINN